MKPWIAFASGAVLAAGLAAVMMVSKREPAEPPPVAQVVSQQSVPVTETPAANLTPEAPAAAPPAQSEPARPASTWRKPAPKPAQTAARREPAADPTPSSPVTPPSISTPTPAPTPAPEPAPAVVAKAREPEPAPAPKPAQSKPAPPPEPNRVTIPAGAVISVRLAESLSSEQQSAGQTFQATLADPLVVDGFVIAERGARVEGKVVEVVSAGRVKGVSRLAIELTRLNTSDGQRVALNTEIFGKEGEQSRKSDATKVAAGAAVGAALGAIFGGGKGAAIGAGSGAAAGTGVVLATKGKEVVLPAETKLSFKTTTPITITEKR